VSGDGTLQLFTFTQAAIYLCHNLSALPKHIIPLQYLLKQGWGFVFGKRDLVVIYS